MPPKKNQQKEAEKKAKSKAKGKVLEDKTFGLKNKNKSKKVQQFIQQTQASAPDKKAAEMAKLKAAERKAAEEAKKEAAKLLQSSIPIQKVPFGVDPKSILCQFFKAGACTRGKNCKFSHDFEVGRKAVKRDLYADDKDEEKRLDTIDNWDEEKLRSVILSKHGNPKTTTDIVCKHFIQAVEDGKYGWFWNCPDTDPKQGKECKYRHSLPAGFVLKTKEQRRLERLALDAQPKITLEDFIETERDKLPKDKLTPINPETFAKWKKAHIQKMIDERQKENFKPVLSGKEIILKKFQNKYFEEEEISKDKGTEIDMSDFKKEIDEIDDEITVKDYGDGFNAFSDTNKVSGTA